MLYNKTKMIKVLLIIGVLRFYFFCLVLFFQSFSFHYYFLNLCWATN